MKNFDTPINVFDTFWQKRPALLYGLAFLFGTALSIAWHWTIIFPIAILLGPITVPSTYKLPLARKLWIACAILAIGFLYTQHTLITPKSNSPISGRGTFSISSIGQSTNYFNSGWIYRGHLKDFYSKSTNKLLAKNIPCVILPSTKGKKSRPTANTNYMVEGTLKPGGQSYFLTSSKPWIPIPHTFSFAEYRHHAKKSTCKYIDHHIPRRRCANFLKGIATGEFSDKEMKYEFSRFGLQHIMAISGFHFAIVAAFFSLFLKTLIPRKKAAMALIFILCSYFLFLGSSPSIMRAWMMIVIVMGGSLLERRGNGLNSLGAAIFIILLVDPNMIHHIGFQFSTLITASILLSFSLFDTLMQQAFPRRNLHEVIEMNTLNQHGYCMITYFRKAFALTLSVNIVSLPASLYYFHKFPWMGLIYNWFFPFMVSISIMLLITGFLFYFLPPLAGLVHLINDKYTHFMLNFAYHLPPTFDIYLRTKAVSLEILIPLLTAIFVLAIFGNNYLEYRQLEKRDFAFI